MTKFSSQEKSTSSFAANSPNLGVSKNTRFRQHCQGYTDMVPSGFLEGESKKVMQIEIFQGHPR